MIVTFLIFCLATIGLTNILVHGKILDEIKIGRKSVRGWMKTPHFISELLDCYECTGWWAGLFVGFVIIAGSGWNYWWFIFLYPFAGSVLSQTHTDLMYVLRSKVEFELPEDDNATEETT